MRITTLAIAGALVACIAVPALAAKKAPATRSWDSCEQLSIQRGVTEGERRATENARPSPWRQFMVDCLAGKITDAPVVAASEPRLPMAARQVPGKWQSCEDLALKRGTEVDERRSGVNAAPSPWRQFMRDCLEGKIH